MCIDYRNNLYAYGSNESGKLGLDLNIKEIDKLTLVGNKKWLKVCANGNTTIAIDTYYMLYAFGVIPQYKSVFFESDLPNESNIPILLSKKVKFKDIELNSDLSFAGININDELIYIFVGFTDFLNNIKPNFKVKKVSLNTDFLIAISTDNKLYGIGINDYGQLGVINKDMYKLRSRGEINENSYIYEIINFTEIVHPNNLKWIDVSCGYSYTLALDEQNYMYGWGSNYESQLGLGSLYYPLGKISL
jgi:alpha-tubulin suppressor-like RCC1 family protein